MEKFKSQVIRLAQVKAMTGLSRSTIYKFMSHKQFPKQIKLGLKSSGWLVDEVDTWIQNQIEDRDNGKIKGSEDGNIK
tara:strand:- start:606 stop:839 length:234 start_codon:yes stop_codon:yes gene_type:complete